MGFSPADLAARVGGTLAGPDTPGAMEKAVDRPPGLSVRLKLTLSYAGFLVLAGALMLAAVWVFLLRSYPTSSLVPRLTNFPRVLDPTNFGPSVFGAAAVVVLAFLLVFGLAGGWLLAGRMLAPLERITDATSLAATGSLSHRIRLPGRRDEFRQLADAFDAMLTELEAHVAEQRRRADEQQRFAANASHELRTPLAITQTLLDVARKDDGREDELVKRLHAVNTRAIDLTEALLLLSRADQRTFAAEPVELSLVAEEATETLLPFAADRGVAIEVSADVTHTTGSPALLLQMATNLLHNAIVHNLPDHGVVWVTTSAHAERVVLTVENTGERLAPQLVATLAEPFQRGSSRVRNDHVGLGLGLAIVRSIVQAHDGTLTLSPRTGGGLSVTVQLPASAAPGPDGPSRADVAPGAA